MIDEDYLVLSTTHSATGQKWKSVFVLNVVDGSMPSDLVVLDVHCVGRDIQLAEQAMLGPEQRTEL